MGPRSEEHDVEWTADVTADSSSGYQLYLELRQNEEYRGRVQRVDGAFRLFTYDPSIGIPVAWLLDVLSNVEHDLPVQPDLGHPEEP